MGDVMAAIWFVRSISIVSKLLMLIVFGTWYADAIGVLTYLDNSIMSGVTGSVLFENVIVLIIVDGLMEVWSS